MANSPETDALRKDLEQLRKDFETLSQSLKNRSSDQIEAGMNRARERFDGLGDEFESRPFTVVLSAFGIGLLLGKLFSR